MSFAPETRLALIRTGIELFGIERVEEEIFSDICSAEVYIYPPESVGISTHSLRVYKPVLDKNGRIHYQEGIALREFACAKGNMTIFVQVPIKHTDILTRILANIAYWGQASSLTYCVNISNREPSAENAGLPLNGPKNAMSNSFSCFVSEFASKELKWDDIVSTSCEGKSDSLKFLLYVWPLEICERHSGNMLLLRRSQKSLS